MSKDEITALLKDNAEFQKRYTYWRERCSDIEEQLQKCINALKNISKVYYTMQHRKEVNLKPQDWVHNEMAKKILKEVESKH